MFYLILGFIAISFLLLWKWEAKRLSRQKEGRRKKAYEKLVAYRSRSDHPVFEFCGKEATVVLRKEDFAPKGGQLAGTFIFLCRNVFDEYFFCVIDVTLSAVHIPKERALFFLKDFPKEYAAEIDYLTTR